MVRPRQQRVRGEVSTTCIVVCVPINSILPLFSSDEIVHADRGRGGWVSAPCCVETERYVLTVCGYCRYYLEIPLLYNDGRPGNLHIIAQPGRLLRRITRTYVLLTI